MRMSEKEEDLPIFDTGILNIFFFLPVIKITAWPTGKIAMQYIHCGRVKGRAYFLGRTFFESTGQFEHETRMMQTLSD